MKGGVVKGTGIIQVISTDFTVPLLHPDSAFADQPFIGIQLSYQHPQFCRRELDVFPRNFPLHVSLENRFPGYLVAGEGFRANRDLVHCRITQDHIGLQGCTGWNFQFRQGCEKGFTVRIDFFHEWFDGLDQFFRKPFSFEVIKGVAADKETGLCMDCNFHP